MIVRRLGVLGCLTLLVGLSAARQVAAATLSPEVRTTTNSQAVRPAIQTFIDAQVAQLSSEQAEARSAARDALIAEVQPAGPGQPQPSALFFDAYADILNTALKPLASHQDTRVRLNVAILTARVAERVNNGRLRPAVIDLLDDQMEAVVLWAVKATKFVLPSVLSNAISRQNDQLVPALLKAAQDYRRSGPVVQSAYESLRAEAVGANAVSPANWSTVVPLMVDPVHKLLETRIAEYQAGIPPLPTAEMTATAFLVDGKVWRSQSKEQQMRTVQATVDLMSVAAQRWEAAGTNERADLAVTLNRAAAAVWVVGYELNNDRIKLVAGVKFVPTTLASEVRRSVETIREAILLVPQFQKLAPAPNLSPLPATTSATDGQ